MIAAATCASACFAPPRSSQASARVSTSTARSSVRRGVMGFRVRTQPKVVQSRAPRSVVRTMAAKSQEPMKSSQMLVIVPPHPLVKHHLAIARNKDTPSGAFRASVAELGKILTYEMTRDWFTTVDFEIEAPYGPAAASIIDPTQPIKLVPILRAGLIPLEQVSQVIPVSETYHVGYVRDEKTLEPTEYLNKLPETLTPEDKVIVSDPMMATGGTMVACLNDLIARGADKNNIRVLCILTCPVALTKLSEGFPGLRVYAAMIDEELNDEGFIVPGLGDAGDRAFGNA